MYQGIIVSIVSTHGYGFIENDVYDRVFFHQRWLRGVRFRDLKEGDTVNFDINIGPRGPGLSICPQRRLRRSRQLKYKYYPLSCNSGIWQQSG